MNPLLFSSRAVCAQLRIHLNFYRGSKPHAADLQTQRKADEIPDLKALSYLRASGKSEQRAVYDCDDSANETMRQHDNMFSIQTDCRQHTASPCKPSSSYRSCLLRSQVGQALLRLCSPFASGAIMRHHHIPPGSGINLALFLCVYSRFSNRIHTGRSV